MAEEAVLEFLHQNDEIVDSGQFATQSRISHDEIVNVIKSLRAFSFVDAQVFLYTQTLMHIHRKREREKHTHILQNCSLFLVFHCGQRVMFP